MVFGICVIFLLLIIGIFLIRYCISKRKRKQNLQAGNEVPAPLDAMYEDPDAVLHENFQPRFLRNVEVRTGDNVAYATQLQVLQDKEVDIKDNLAYSTGKVKTEDNVAYSTQLELLQDEEVYI